MVLWSLVVVETDPVSNDTAGVLQTLQPMAVHALVFEGANYAFIHAIFLKAVRSDQLLLQSIALDQRGVAAGGAAQAIVRSEKKWFGYFA